MYIPSGTPSFFLYRTFSFAFLKSACVTRILRSRRASKPASVHAAFMSAPDISSCNGKMPQPRRIIAWDWASAMQCRFDKGFHNMLTLAMMNSSRFTSSARVIFPVWMPKIRRLVFVSGRGNSIFRSIRPGLMSAGSNVSILLVAIMTCVVRAVSPYAQRFIIDLDSELCRFTGTIQKETICMSEGSLEKPMVASSSLPTRWMRVSQLTEGSYLDISHGIKAIHLIQQLQHRPLNFPFSPRL